MIRQYITAFLLCAGLLLVAGNVSYAQDVSIAVVDVEKVLNESRAGKSIQAQLTARREAFQKEFTSRENNLVESEKNLIEQKSEMPAEEFATKRREFEQQLLETRNLFQKRRNSLDKGLNGALTDLRKNIIQVTAEVADEKDYKVVLTRDSVVIVEKEMDITETVLKRLDTKIQTIKLDVAK
jgi:Skp family chaperone for outer membrane proteins